MKQYLRKSPSSPEQERRPGAGRHKGQPAQQALLAAILLLASGGTWAQAAPPPPAAPPLPDAGALRRQIEREAPPPLPEQRAKDATEPRPRPAPQAAEGLRVPVRAIEFRGNTLISTDELGTVVAPWLGRSLSLAEMQAAAAAVGEAYRSRGWVVRSLLPRQAIEDGVLRIEIVEARMGRVRIEGEPGGLVSPERVAAVVSAPLKAGEPLNVSAVNRGLLLADELVGVGVSGRLLPGMGEAETDIALRLSGEPRFSGDVGLDNSGSRSTEATRASVNLAVASPFGLGDQASASLMGSKGSRFLRLAYAAPVGASGLRLGASASAFRYKLVADEFSALDGRGNSRSFGLNASYPLIRDVRQNLYLSASWDRRHYENDVSGTTVSDYRVDEAALTASYNRFDDFFGGGVTAVSVGLVSARVDLAGSANEAADAAGPEVNGRSTKVRWQISRNQALTESLSLYAGLSGQLTGRNQDSSQKFYLGGPAGVRAYPGDEAGGSGGVLARVELRARLPWDLNLTGFYDWGRAKLYADNDFGGSTHNRYSLQGAGLSLAWQGPHGLLVQGSWARRIGSNPNATASGNDADGTHRRNRFWISASLPF